MTTQIVPPSAARDAAALRLLEAAPRWCFPMAEGLRRGASHAVDVTDAFVTCRLLNGDPQIWAREASQVGDILAMHPDWGFVNLCGPGLGQEACRAWGISEERIEPFHLAVYERGTRLPVAGSLDVLALGVEWAPTVREHYSHPEFFPLAEIERRCEAGTVLGGFDEAGELVGYIGTHAEGSMGMLEVFEGHRRRGYAVELEGAKANEHLSHGWTPWAQIFVDNQASIELQRKLGLTLTPADEQCFLARD